MINSKARIKTRGKFCTRPCSLPCVGEKVLMLGALHKDIDMDKRENSIVVRFFRDNTRCSGFSIDDLEMINKYSKPFGIVEFCKKYY